MEPNQMGQSRSPEELLEDSSWLNALARSLTRDAHAADDAVQSGWLALLTSPVHAHTPAAWLRIVVRRVVGKRVRENARRLRREQSVALPEAKESAHEDLVEKAELHRIVVEEVLQLSEPYRSTVLLRYFGGLTTAEVAERQGVPVKTVFTRLGRAHDKLKAALDRSYHGDRTAWHALMLPWAGSSAASTATASVVASSGTALGSSSLFTTLATKLTWIIGGTIMATKTSAGVLALIAVLACAAGIAIDRFALQESPKPATSEEDYTELEQRHDELASQLATALDEISSLERKQQAENARVAELEGEVKELREPTVVAETPEKETAGISIAFGEWAEVDGLKNANWSEMAEATLVINGLVAQIVEDLKAGRPISPALQSEIQEENMKLVKFYASIMGDIPTEAMTNGEFSHPVAMANLMNSMLEAEQSPLSEAQRAHFARAGDEYDLAYREAHAAYDESTLKVEKVLDELLLKGIAKDRFVDALNEQQRNALIDPDFEERMFLDTLSPATMAQTAAIAKPYDSREDVRSSLPKLYASRLGVEESALAPYGQVFDRYMQTVESVLTPVEARNMAGMFRRQDAEIAGTAHVEVLRELMRSLQLDEEALLGLRNDATWPVPRILPSE